MTQKTYTVKASDIDRKWWILDADGAILGRLAAKAAHILRGKHKPMFAPHLDNGDHVIVLNADKVRLTGKKMESKIWYRHSGYPGALREIPYSKLLKEKPEMAVEKAIRGMLPKTRLGRAMFHKLKVYQGTDHPHAPQKPEPWKSE